MVWGAPRHPQPLKDANQVREQIREGEGPRLPPGAAVDMRHIAQRRHSIVSYFSAHMLSSTVLPSGRLRLPEVVAP